MDSDNYVRNRADVDSILHHAKIEKDRVKPTTQVLYFSDVTEGTRLIELDSTLLQELTVNKRFYFRGMPEDKTVLCTDSKTYDVKEAETSNSMLLVPDLLVGSDLNQNNEESLERKEVVNTHYTYLEAKPMKPKTRLLRVLLEMKSYDGKELEPDSYSVEDGYYTFQMLMESVQISAKELKVALENLYAFELEGFWRVMGFDYHYRALSFILNIIEEHSWDFRGVPIGEAIQILRELLPKFIADHILSVYFSGIGECDDEGMELYELNQRKVCRLLGEALLKSVGKISVSDFMDTWQQSVPEGMDVKFEIIEDLCYVEQLTNSEVVCYFPEYKLSEDIQERFSELFKVKEKWILEEISPFISKLTSDKQSVKSVLTKYTRASVANGVTYYNARHSK